MKFDALRKYLFERAVASFDRRMKSVLQRSLSGKTRKLLEMSTVLGLAVVCDGLLILWGLFTASAWPMIIALSDVAVHLLVVAPLRYFFRRPRPRPVKPLLCPWNEYSFPSAHATRAALVATMWTLRSPVGGLLVFIPLAAAVGVSRILLERHHPSDVVGGWILGFACGLLLAFVLLP